MLLEAKYSLQETPVEEAIPMYGITKCLCLRKWGCFNPNKASRLNAKDIDEHVNKNEEFSSQLSRGKEFQR
jgi:hypothetical protein